MKRLVCLLLALAALCTGSGCHRSPESTATTAASPIRFEDVTSNAGLRFTRENGIFGKKWLPETLGGGGGFVDLDNDGWLDIVLVNGDFWPGHAPAGKPSPPLLSVFHNNHDGTFTDITDGMGVRDVHGYGMGVAAGDFDGDGFDDLFVTAVGSARLFRNVGGHKLVAVPAAASGIRDTGWSTSSAWLDYDNDGRLDLFVCHYLRWTPATDQYCGTSFKAYCGPQTYPGESCRLYRNRGNGKFEDATRKAGIYSENAKALGVCIRDIDGDDRPDILVANDTTPNNLYHNNGDGTFTDRGVVAGIAFGMSGTARAGMGIDAARTGKSDVLALAIANFSQEGLAFFELGGKRGEIPLAFDRARTAGLYGPSYPLLAFGLIFVDFDNDGAPDLFVTNGHIESEIDRIRPTERFAQPNLVFRNVGDGSGNFVDVSRAAGPGVTAPLVGRAACRGDFDNDGKIDVLLTSNLGGPRLLRNVSAVRGHWLAVKAGIGAIVRVAAGGKTQTAPITSGSSYLATHDPRAHFGVGSAATVDRVTVTWPDGKTETREGVPVDQTVIFTRKR